MQASLHWVNRDSNCGLGNEVGSLGRGHNKEMKLYRKAKKKKNKKKGLEIVN